MIKDEPVDITKLRYVLYARKSTIDEGSQVRSLPDQIRECRRKAESLGIKIVAEIREKGSAKKPNKRPAFTQMLKEVRAGKYDGIICWHPDRLCRNMLEAGEIIDMLDDHTLKDLRFYSHEFSNDANGKMLLGMLFVFSKQYSDDLSAKVRRGVTNNFDEGKSSGTPKWGYTRSDITGLYEPNEYYEIVQEAWHRRANGATNKEIYEFLLEGGVNRKTKINKKNKRARVIYPTEKGVGTMFGDPFYYGVLIQAQQTVDLREVYQFEPMVDQALYDAVQALGYARKRDVMPKKNLEFKPLMHMVYCGVCGSDRWMIAGKNKRGDGQHVLSYRCDNPNCTRRIKSVRAKYVFEGLYKALDQLANLSDDAYERYSKRLSSLTDEKIVAIKQQVFSKNGQLAHIKKELDDRALRILDVNKDSPVYSINDRKITELDAQRNRLEAEVQTLRDKIANPDKIRISKEEFLNLVKIAPDKMRNGSAVEKDRLARILFLNLRLDNENGLSYIWREPFASLIKATEIPFGADKRT